ncbi:hypothetical protein Anas_00703 [Armadillidium nasatum]|uniref:Uncharacterized protein n=1 Tax=Armadillidium nasatum TaxID=96803 RepID=A0A5N5SPQ4_9CRUS|nr:hypothetical protein Anas_00703 [Armadillidium nasatum]
MKESLKESHYIHCTFFCSHPSGNVPLFTDNVDEAEAYKFLENYLKERKENKHICMGYKPGYGESEQNFAYPYKRQETFKNWPLDFFPESLIEGWIYLYRTKHLQKITFRALTDYEKDLLLKHPIGKFMTELLQYSDVKIKETLSSFLTKYGVMPITVGQVISFMTMNKDQYDADFRKEMKFGNQRATFVSFAEDMSERLIYASELKSKDFKQIAKIQ